MSILNIIISLVMPVAMLVVGIMWKVHPPKREGGVLAYRTALTQSSQEAWDFAHKHCARLWVRLGVLLTVGASVAMYLLRDKDYASFLPWVLAVEATLFCVSAFLVDALVKQKFEEEKED